MCCLMVVIWSENCITGRFVPFLLECTYTHCIVCVCFIDMVTVCSQDMVSKSKCEAAALCFTELKNAVMVIASGVNTTSNIAVHCHYRVF